MAIDLSLKIEKWKNRLLDLGKRNRLLNYRETKRTSLSIHSPECITLWNYFVKNASNKEIKLATVSPMLISSELFSTPKIAPINAKAAK